MRRKTIVVLLAAGLFVGIAADVWATSHQGPPAVPSWVNPDGSLNMAQAPEFFSVYLPDGTQGYITKYEEFPTPPLPGTTAAPRPVYAAPDTHSKVIGALP